jgi:hypothetical protein
VDIQRTDLAGAIWHKSARSNNGGACVEVASNLPGIVAVRDSKRREDGAHVVEREAFAQFLDDIKAGRFDI